MVHDRLRQAREAKGISLAALEDKIGVRKPILAAIDRGAFTDLPTGLYGRHAVRAYATAVGLNADSVLEEVSRLLPPLEDPLDGLARVRGFARRSERGSSGDEHPAPPERGEAADGGPAELDWRRLGAGAIDGAVLALAVLVVAKLTALAAGAPVSEVVPVALPAWGFLALLIAVTYFVLLGGLRNATFGAAVTGARVQENGPGILDARSVVRRGMQCALRESSILVEWLLGSFGSHGRLRALNQRG